MNFRKPKFVAFTLPMKVGMRSIRIHCIAVGITALAGLASSAAAQAKARRNAEPQDLHGSKESVEKMYDFATSHGMTFYLTQTNIDDAIARGRLVPLTGDSTYELTRGVGFSYSTREARAFVQAFAPQYLTACGAPLTLTSAARPTSKQPHNANPHSVHPTGIAVDIRRPYRGPCLDWVRTALTELERKGIIEATEEHHPVHLHIAVLVPPGGRVALPNMTAGLVAQRPQVPVQSASQVMGASSGEVSLVTPPAIPAAPGQRTYVVRQGDTLWDIANKLGVTVDALTRANNLKKKSLNPGTTLLVPTRTGS
jgi:LysM repeat protein